ncbi:hypothetical protein [Psychroflexus salis]|uniref:Uncharacterized protein n=1 Tax=Psychroflexus salis TaxID=1526574 RepID=A0A916ZUZ4_9FLAO|nr:hypothetical protein [Psychroflexus salis]GGE14558.1 hypothetical protein GCM10010831_14900 [Psychroflexus salis]
MKKLVLTLVLGVFAFAASGFKSDNLNDGCHDYAFGAVNAEQEAFGEIYDYGDYYNAYYWYYNICVGAPTFNSDLLTPVIVK